MTDKDRLIELIKKGVDDKVTNLLENAIDVISEDKIHQIKVGLSSGGVQ